jgi:cytochrome P450
MTMDHAPVYDFDVFADPLMAGDVLGGYVALKDKAPPFFWTPRNGGHWVALASDDVLHIMQHPEKFSSRQMTVPANPEGPVMIPLSLDPPEHKRYRQFLRPWFESAAIAKREPLVSRWAGAYIDRVVARGQCEFVEDLASRFPVSVFMEMFGLPLVRIDEFRDLMTEFFLAVGQDDRQDRTGRIMAIVAELIAARTATPQDDLLSELIAADFEDRKLTLAETISISFLMFLAGLETVTHAMSFAFRHLGAHPQQQQQLIDNPDLIPSAVEELMRRYSFVAVARQSLADTEIAGVTVRAGELVHCALNLVGLDAGLNPDPGRVDFERPRCRHAGFGNGVHTCLGIHLARLELRTFLQLWFEKIGLFRLTPDAPKTPMRGGTVMALSSLYLDWPTA